MDDRLHPIAPIYEAPAHFTFPFNYTPHPLCVAAAAELQQYLAARTEWKEETDGGKMFGVLVVKDEQSGRLGFLAAYSGLLAGRNDWLYFVPPVFDSQQPDGYFKTNEREISAINARISQMQKAPELCALRSNLADARKRADAEAEAYRQLMKDAKAERDRRRSGPIPPTADEDATMKRESQFQKAELRRIRKRHDEAISSLRQSLDALEAPIARLKQKRKQMSDDLQHWLFSQYNILNAKGETCNLCDIFSNTPQGVPPSGAGDCCAPKLLQYAYSHHLRPLCMAEFWWGKSPKTEIRHHLHYYPACQSKCKPILGFMLQGLDVDPDPHNKRLEDEKLRILYLDADIIVVSKPSGMLSMPGLVDRCCVADALREELGEGWYMPAHRLDMDTSGILVVARTEEALRLLHRQFADRTVSKRYTALLDGTPHAPRHGFIRLPLAPSTTHRPQQIVDHENGKPAITEYEITGTTDGKTRIRLYPHTGRTHQLRVHCAHAEGLATPIVGDNLYGHPSASRLMLHAEHIAFRHPTTGRRMEFTDERL